MTKRRIDTHYFFSSRPATPGEGQGPDSRKVFLWGVSKGREPRRLVHGYETGNRADISGALLYEAQPDQLVDDAQEIAADVNPDDISDVWVDWSSVD